MNVECLFIWEADTDLFTVEAADHLRILEESGIHTRHLVLNSDGEGAGKEITSYLQKNYTESDRVALVGTGTAGTAAARWMADPTACPWVKAVIIRSAMTDPLTAYGVYKSESLLPSKEKPTCLKEHLISLIPDAPIASAHRFTLPCLILHGRKDRRYSYIQAEDLFSSMKDRCPDTPVRLCLLPQGDQNLAVSASCSEQKIQAEELFHWINRYCAEESLSFCLTLKEESKDFTPVPDHLPHISRANADKVSPAPFPSVPTESASSPVMEDFLSLRYPGSPAGHPENEITAWVESHWDSTIPVGFRSFCEEIRIHDRKSGITQTVTAGGNHETSPIVLKDGTILFLSNADVPRIIPEQGTLEMRKVREYYGDRQLYACPPGKPARRLTGMLHGVNTYSVSPDERWILFTSDLYTGTDSLENLCRVRSDKEREDLAKASITAPVIITNPSFKSDADYGYKAERKETVWLLSLSDGNLSSISDEEHPMKEPTWLPDSSGLLYYRCNESGQIVFCKRTLPEGNHQDLAVVDEVTASYDGCQPCFSPDGQYLLFAANLPGDDFNYARLPYLIPEDRLGSQEPIKPIPLIDPKFENDGVIPMDMNFLSKGERGRCFLAMPDGYCYYTGAEEGSVHLKRIPISEKGGAQPETIFGDTSNFRDLTAVKGGLIALYSDPSHLPEVVFLPLPGCLDASEKLLEKPFMVQSEINPGMKNRTWVEPKEILIRTLDGKDRIQGWLLLPERKPDHADRIPMVVHVHGGPNGFYSTALNLEFQAYCAAGFAVLFCNPRGGSGYTRSHGAMSQAWDDTAMNDILQVVDEALRRCTWIDPDRVGITGGSYGGFQTIWSAGRCKRYKAASAVRPFANARMITACSHSAGSSTRDEYEGFRDALAESVKSSPNSYADGITIPFQILCSELDANCIPEGAMQLYGSLRILSPELPVRLIIYPDANHGLQRNGPMELAVMQFNDNLNWFREML